MNRHSLHNSITVIERREEALFVITFWRGERPLETRFGVDQEMAQQRVEELERLYGSAEVYEGKP